MRSFLTSRGALSALVLTALLSACTLVSAQTGGKWGTVKGQVVYDAKDKIPDNPAVTVTADKNVCIQGKIHRNEWVVDPKTRGVKNVLVWLSDVKNPAAAWKAPINPKLKKAPATYEIDQPTCTFAPRVTAIREETKVVFKNNEKIAHNVKVEGGNLGPNINQLIPPGKAINTEVKARFIPISYSCTIHPWMKGWIASFKHPYFAVTDEKGNFEIKDAPAGKYRLQVWHEGYGFVQKSKDNRGIIITITDGKVTEAKIPALKKED